jgi:hypothetical protein
MRGGGLGATVSLIFYSTIVKKQPAGVLARSCTTFHYGRRCLAVREGAADMPSRVITHRERANSPNTDRQGLLCLSYPPMSSRLADAPLVV